MKPFELEPRYSTNELPGKCIKCLGEQELNSCLMQMLREEPIDKDVRQRYEALVTFLESEKYLAEGKKVSIVIGSRHGRPEYKLKIE
jgi:hypothetical protein